MGGVPAATEGWVGFQLLQKGGKGSSCYRRVGGVQGGWVSSCYRRVGGVHTCDELFPSCRVEGRLS